MANIPKGMICMCHFGVVLHLLTTIRASRFEVTLPFLLQQAAWLYERQLLQVRAQMRKVGASKAAGNVTPSPIPGSDSAGGESMRRTTSGGGTGM